MLIALLPYQHYCSDREHRKLVTRNELFSCVNKKHYMTTEERRDRTEIGKFHVLNLTVNEMRALILLYQTLVLLRMETVI